MSGAFTPRPGAAPLRQQVLAQARMETRLTLRNGEQLLLAVVIPIVVLVGAVVGADHVDLGLSEPAVDVFTPGVLALAIMSTAFTSLAIMTGFERRYGVLKRLGASPLPRHGLLAAKVLSLLLVEALQVLLICVVALALGWDPATAGWAGALLAGAAGTAAFAAWGLFLAGTLRAEATLAAANLVYLLLLAGGGVVLPSSWYGGAAWLVRSLPSGALGDAMRAALLHGTVDWTALAALVAWAVVGAVLTTRTFKWE